MCMQWLRSYNVECLQDLGDDLSWEQVYIYLYMFMYGDDPSWEQSV
jgi:hypothetical protein